MKLLSFDIEISDVFELGKHEDIEKYAPFHIFQFFNQAGFPVGLEKVAEGMGIPQKKLMDGADAPKQWRAGNHQEVMVSK
jgi:hypothetical protein